MRTLNVSRKELAENLMAFKLVEGMACFSSIIQETKPKMNVKSRVTKEPNKFGLVTKRSELNVILNAKYESQVVNQLAREGKNESEYKRGDAAMEIVFGDNNKFFGVNPKNEKLVICYRPNPNEKNLPKSIYFANGIKISKSELVDYLQTTNHATNQGTEKEILWRTVYFENIKQMVLTIKLKNDLKAEKTKFILLD